MPARKNTRDKIATIADEAARERLYATLDLADSLQTGKTQEAKDIERVLKSLQDEEASALLQARLGNIGENTMKSDEEIIEDIKLLGYTLAEVAYHGLGKMATAETHARTHRNGTTESEDESEAE